MLRKLSQSLITPVYPLHKPLFTFRSYSKKKIDYQPYQVDRLTWDAIQSDVHELKKRNPLAIEVLHRIDVEGMSLGSISPLTHGHISQAVMALAGVRTHAELVEKYYATDHMITSNCGEGGDLNKHLAKQLASARFAVDLDYIIEAVIAQYKAAQGVKPGVGGALSGFKVNELIAFLRNCEPWTDLYSPGPHADQYSIEDLRLLLKGYLLANPRLVASIKLASEPGVDTIALGSLKAMGMSEQGRRNNIVITGKGSTGNTPMFTKYHTTFPWIVGLARTHARLVEAGLRESATLTASGGFVGSFFSPFVWGADRVGVATMALVGDGCIMVRKCHDNTCPTGVATQDPTLIAKNTGNAHSIARVLLAAAELTAIEMQPYFDHVSHAVGRAPDVLDAITNGPLSGQEEYLTLLKKKPRFISLKKLPPQSGPSYKESEIIEAIRSRKQTQFNINANNEQIAFGTRISALTKTDDDIRDIAREHGIRLNFSGFTGQNLGILGAPGVTFDASQVHTNDSTGKSLSGAEVYAKTCGNQAGFAMTEGLLVTRGVGSRGAVRKSGGIFMTEYAGAFFANFHTRGTTIILGKPEHYKDLKLTGVYQPPFAFKKHALDFGFLSGFSGGCIIIPRKLWMEALDLKHVSPTVSHQVKVVSLSEQDKTDLLEALKKAVLHLDSALQHSILAAIKANPALIEEWFVKLNPPLPKAQNPAIGQLSLAEEKLTFPTASNGAKAAPAYQTTNANIVMPPDREKAACGTSLVMQLDKEATHEIVELGVKALGNSEHRGASGGDPLSGDGCGLMVGFGKNFFEVLPEFLALNLVHHQFGIISVFMPKNQQDFSKAEELLNQAAILFDLKISGKRAVPTNEDKLGIQAKADEIQLMHYVVEAKTKFDRTNSAEFDQLLSKAHLHFEFTAQQMPMQHKAHIASASRRFVVYKTKGKEKYIADIYPDLKNPQLTANVVMGHSRFATNTDTLIESVQPLPIAMFNGEINNLRRFIEELQYHPHFSRLIKVDLSKFNFTHYSDSAIMSFYMKMLQLLGYSSQQIHDAIFHPYSPKNENAVSEFHDLVGMPGLEGPDGSIRVFEKGDEIKISIEMDSLGWRPHRGVIDKKRRILVTGSELGIVPDLSGDVIELGPGEAFEIDAVAGTYGSLNLMQITQVLFEEKLAKIALINPSDTYDYVPIELSSAELSARKLRANITPEIEKSILEPMFEDGKGFTVSMGDDGGDEVTVSGPTRFVNTLKTQFAQITRPPLDYQREGEVMSGMTYIGSRALPEHLYVHNWNGFRVNNPILDNDQMGFLLQTAKLKTVVIDCTYPVRGRDAAMLAAIERVSKGCIEAAKQGVNLIVLSDLSTNANQAPLLPAILTGMVDLALRKAGVRHLVTLCLQSSICVTPLEQIAAISLGINVINPYLIFMPDKLFIENKEKFIRQRKSYLTIALKEILAASARVGIRTLSAGYQGARQLSALGLDKEVADSLGIYSELSGIDWANIAATVTDMHTRPGNIGKYQHGQEPREGKWNVPLVSLWRSIAKGEKTLAEVMPDMLRNIKTAERDNVEGWFKKKAPMIWTAENPMTVIIVGGGAAGFMQAQALLDSTMGKKIKIKILEENPASLFGMVKDGIAPDKLETRKMQFTLLSKCLNDPRVEYYGGIEVGKKGAVTFEELNKDYPCVIDCRGAPNDREATEIDGHELMISASKVWKAYNGYFDPLNPDRYWPFKEYSRSQVKIVIGNGNVAADLIRNLLTSADNLDGTAIQPNFYDRLRKQKPSFIRNIARGSVTQCKITLKELESFEKNGILVRASFDEKNINTAELTDEQLEKLKFFKRAKSAPPVLGDQVCVHFHFGYTPKKVCMAGKNILEMEVVDENGVSEFFRGGDVISAIGREVPEEISNTPFVAGWVSGTGGNLAIIQQSVAANTVNILAHDEKRQFDHKMGPVPERAWERHASVTNQGFLNIIAYYAAGNLMNTIADWRKARDYQAVTPVVIAAEKQSTRAASGPALSVLNPKTNQLIALSLNNSSKSVYHLLKETAANDPEVPVPDNECSEAGTCMRCVAEVSTPINLKASEKANLTAIFGKKSPGLFLTCQHPVSDLTANDAQVVTVKNPVKMGNKH